MNLHVLKVAYNLRVCACYSTYPWKLSVRSHHLIVAGDFIETRNTFTVDNHHIISVLSIVHYE